MTSNKSSLLSHIDTITKFVSDRIAQDQSYKNIDQQLKELSDSLKTGKITLQILGCDSSQIQSLQKLLETNSALLNSYQLKTCILPEIPDPTVSPLPSLVLQASDRTKEPTRYELKTAHTQIIGRNPSAAQILLPDDLNLAGGSHIEIKPAAGGNWQIRDLSSRNGTFINGNPTKPQDWYTLKPNDLICLGSASQALGSAILAFEVPTKDYVEPAILKTQKLLDSDIICLIVPPQPFSENIQRFLHLIPNSHIAKLFIVIDRLGGISNDALKETLTIIKISAQQKLQSTSFEILSLLLKPFVPSSGATVVVPNAQPEFEQFSDRLINLSKESAQTILVEQATKKLNHLIDRIEAILVQKDMGLKQKLQNDEERLKELSQGTLKNEIERVYRKVDSDRDAFFRQSKNELSQSKSNLLDEFRQSSISHKIQQFAKRLQPQISDRGGYRYVGLQLQKKEQVSTNDVHAMATELCHKELTQWTTTEWKRIQNEYSDGGLNALLKRSYDSLRSISEIELSKDGFSVSQSLSIQSILSVSNVQPSVEQRYKQVGFWGYMFKNLKGQIIAIVGTITTLGSGFIPNDAKLILIPTLIPFTLGMVFLTHKQEKEAKVDETTEKLRKETVAYYQSYVKGLVDRLVQRIGTLIDAEDRNFRETLANVKEIHASHLAELDETKKQLKSQLDEIKRSDLSKSEKDLAELRKIKQSL